MFFVFFFKQKTAYEMRISDWSSDVCSSDLTVAPLVYRPAPSRCGRSDDAERDRAGDRRGLVRPDRPLRGAGDDRSDAAAAGVSGDRRRPGWVAGGRPCGRPPHRRRPGAARSEEHTSELQSLMRISYAVFCLKKKKTQHEKTEHMTAACNTHKATAHTVDIQ